ncbi:sugar transferase [Rhodophyticola sp. CCM32]|uniref:sugar transferase n=1 Tax=Rhodophyticola sp. CCM32 TaxID=2916397 RepID=UPI001EE5C739|nr:sugar transferase [Rhodophyticola sp. CCM32]
MTWQKRIFDLGFAICLTVILGPVLIGLLIWLWRVQGGPLFYISERMRAPGHPFGLLKLRTMTVAKHDAGVSGGHKRARITPAGRWLRARRLDELPQLWNILKGDLSFVGPRPPLREYVEKCPALYTQVLKNRPGVTGLASLVYCKHEHRLLARCRTAGETDRVYTNACIPRKARLDLIYQRHSNLCFDVLLIIATIRQVFWR